MFASIKTIFAELTTQFRVDKVLWIGEELLCRLPRIEKKNWFSIPFFSEYEFGLMNWENEGQRLWFWEQALNSVEITTQNLPHSNLSVSFFPVYHPDEKKRLGVFAIENSGLDLLGVQKVLREAARHLAFCHEFQEAKTSSYVDDLTSLFNHRYLPKVLAQEIDRCQRQDKKFSLLFLDMDYFKKVNDGHGHLMGSRLLIEVASILKRSVRSYDPLFRYGGDEFLILLVDTDKSTGEKVAERIRRAIESHEFVFEDASIKLTASIGLSVFPDNAKSAKELIQLADQAMYYGKNKSRNIVYIAS